MLTTGKHWWRRENEANEWSWCSFWCCLLPSVFDLRSPCSCSSQHRGISWAVKRVLSVKGLSRAPLPCDLLEQKMSLATSAAEMCVSCKEPVKTLTIFCGEDEGVSGSVRKVSSQALLSWNSTGGSFGRGKCQRERWQFDLLFTLRSQWRRQQVQRWTGRVEVWRYWRIRMCYWHHYHKKTHL